MGEGLELLRIATHPTPPKDVQQDVQLYVSISYLILLKSKAILRFIAAAIVPEDDFQTTFLRVLNQQILQA